VSCHFESQFISCTLNAFPFEPEHAYTKFAAYTILSHRGDFTAAAKTLADAGYGDRNGVTKSGLRTIAAPRVLARGGLRTISSKEVPTWR
jgi:hypothetical protein